jgi:hypothetical protein
VRGGGGESQEIRPVSGLNVKEAAADGSNQMPQPQMQAAHFGDEGTETEWTVLEIKCQHCGKLVRLYCGPDGIEAGIYGRKKRRR